MCEISRAQWPRDGGEVEGDAPERAVVCGWRAVYELGRHFHEGGCFSSVDIHEVFYR